MRLPWTVTWLSLAAFCLEQTRGVRPEDEQKASEPAVEETVKSKALPKGDINLEATEAMREACGTAEGDKTVRLSSLQNCIQQQQKKLSEKAAEILAAKKTVEAHHTRAPEYEQQTRNKEAPPTGLMFAGKGYCRDSTCQHRASCSHPWIQSSSCVSLSQCQQACNGCAAISWSAKPSDDDDSCRSQNLSRCVVYRGSPTASTTTSNHQEYICYRPQ